MASVRKDLHFAQIPEWVLFHDDLSAQAIRIYGVLCRYADKENQAHPKRRTLANHINVRSLDTVDRALRELVDAAAVTVEQRFDSNGDQTSNEYTVHLAPPEGIASRVAQDDVDEDPGSSGRGRTDRVGVAAPVGTPRPQESGGGEPHRSGGGGRRNREGGGRTDAATPAAQIVHEREPFEVVPPNPQPAGGTSCAVHGTNPRPNRRCCGTTAKQLAAQAAIDAAARRRAAEQAAIADERARAAIAPGTPPDFRDRVAQARRAAG